MVDPSEVRIIVPEPPPRRRGVSRRIWWGTVGTLVGIVVGPIFVPYPSAPTVAVYSIYGACMGAVIGFAIQYSIRRPKLKFDWNGQFSLRTLLVGCYIIAVVFFVVRGIVILRSL